MQRPSSCDRVARLRFPCVGRCNRLFVVAPLVVVCALAVCDVPEMFLRRARVVSRVSRFRTCSLRVRRMSRAFTCGFRVLNVRIRLNCCRVRVFGLIVMDVRLALLMAQPKRSLVSFPPKKEEGVSAACGHPWSRRCRRRLLRKVSHTRNHDGEIRMYVMCIMRDDGDGDDYEV